MVTSLTQETKKADPTAATVSVVADERTNSVLVGGDKSQRLAVRAMIAQLDSATDMDGYTQVVYLRYAEAEQLAPVLEEALLNAWMIQFRSNFSDWSI